jgi:hypothetical protein
VRKGVKNFLEKRILGVQVPTFLIESLITLNDAGNFVVKPRRCAKAIRLRRIKITSAFSKLTADKQQKA